MSADYTTTSKDDPTVRSCIVKTPKGESRRPVVNLCILQAVGIEESVVGVDPDHVVADQNYRRKGGSGNVREE